MLNFRLQHITSTIKEKKLPERHAILNIPVTFRRASSGKPKPVTAGRTVKKVGRPKMPSTKKGKPFLNNNTILTNGRLHFCVFGGDHKELNYAKEEHDTHDKECSRQLKSLVTERSGINDQALPSPPGMPKHEDVHVNEKLGDFICIHPGMNGKPEPDFGGDRVREYIRILRLTVMTNCLCQVFSMYADCAMFHL